MSNPAQDFADTNAEILQHCPREHSFGVTPDAMMAAGAYVQREFGHTGYIVRLITGDYSGALWELSSGDGSTRRLWTDRWGNVGLVADAVTV